MIHLERTSVVSDGNENNQFTSYQFHYIESEDKLSQLIALEQQLELTEKRFKNLQNYVEYIRNLYHGSIQGDMQDPEAIQLCSLSVLPDVEINQNESYLLVRDIRNDGGAGGDVIRKKHSVKQEKERRKSSSKRSSPRRNQSKRKSVSSRTKSELSRPSSKKSQASSPLRFQRGDSQRSSRKTLLDDSISVNDIKRPKSKSYDDDKHTKSLKSPKKLYCDEKKHKNEPLSSKRIFSDGNSSKRLLTKGTFYDCPRELNEETNESKSYLKSKPDLIREECDVSKDDSNDFYQPEKDFNKSTSKRTLGVMTSPKELENKERKCDKSVSSLKSSKRTKKQRSILKRSSSSRQNSVLREKSISRHSCLLNSASQINRMQSPAPNFNFRSIPFIAGKALTKSHNLGVKIQETLSIIKSNTPAKVTRHTGHHLVPPRSAKSACNPISRGRPRQQVYSSRSQYHSRSTTITSRPAVSKSCPSLSSRSSCTFIEDMNDTAETNMYLKKALIYIQSDFTETLEKYKAMSNENNPDDAEKLKDLEFKLDRKEEVIKAFSKLYAQVVELRKKLEGGITTSYKKRQYTSVEADEVCSSYPVVKLTRLLRKIQDFQYKMQSYQDMR